jgi:hypothetical protein
MEEERVQAFKAGIRVLERFHTPYSLQADLPCLFGGRPRATFDIDIVVEIKPEDVPKIVKEFSGDYYIVPHAIYEAICIIHLSILFIRRTK